MRVADQSVIYAQELVVVSKKPHLKNGKQPEASKRKRKEKGKRDPRTPMQRVVVIGPSGKRRLEWRPW